MRKMMWLAAGLAVSLAGCDLAGPGGNSGYGYNSYGNSNGSYSQPAYRNSNSYYGQSNGYYQPSQPQPYYRSGPFYSGYN